jgi:drug/metabolite transporter (DMT)-like permease
VAELAAVLLAMLSSSLYAAASALQALEARRAPAAQALRASLLGGLVRRKLWLAGTGSSVLGWVLQAAALSLASVALVQPALGLGLIVLLVLGSRVLHERVGAREVAGAVAIAGSVAVLAWAGPAEATSFTTAGSWAVAVAIALTAAAPFALRLAGRSGGLPTSIVAGLGWACVGLATALAVSALSDRRWLVMLAWGAGVLLASGSTLLAEMTALQSWPATRSIPVVFGLEMALPAALAPVLSSGASPPHPLVFALALAGACAGAAVLGSTKTVASQLAPESAQPVPGTTAPAPG